MDKTKEATVATVARKKLSFIKAWQLKKLGYFKLPKTGHIWVGSPFKWARIMNDHTVMLYTEPYLITTPIEVMTEKFVYLNNPKVKIKTKANDEIFQE